MSALRTIAILEDDAPDSVDLSSDARFDDQARPHLPEDLGLYRFLDESEPGDRPKLRARRRVVRSARKKQLRNVSLD